MHESTPRGVGLHPSSTYIGRQPIVDRHRQLVAYELLFRSSVTATVADFDEIGRAAVRVMANTFASLGVDAVLGHARGFFNVTEDLLLSHSIEALPKDRVVLEILEDVPASAAVLARCRALHESGYSIALDDWREDDPREALLPWVSIVKVDLPAFAPRSLRALARHLRSSGVDLLAEKVETADQFALCRAAGFDLFQGYFFAAPMVLEGAEVDATRSTLLRVLQQISSNAEISTLVETFKQDARLGLSLLRLVNSAGQRKGMRLESIEAAVVHLGRQQLGRWVEILLYAGDSSAEPHNPLLTLAIHRGRLMEGLAAALDPENADAGQSERAFLVGMLSLADALLGRPLPQLVQELGLADSLAHALTAREGRLGSLLTLAEQVERGEVSRFEPVLEARGLDLPRLQSIDDAAYAWVHGVTAATGI